MVTCMHINRLGKEQVHQQLYLVGQWPCGSQKKIELYRYIVDYYIREF